MPAKRLGRRVGEEVDADRNVSEPTPPTTLCTQFIARTMASFKDQLAGFKGLRATLEKKEVKEAAQARKAQAAKQATKEIGERLLRAGATVRANMLPILGNTAAPITEKRTLALLFLVIDGLPFEDQWREWLRRQDGRTEVKVWVHAKHPEKISSSWVRKRLLPTSYRPAWGSVEITRAELELLRVAIEDPAEMQRFLFASESCLPLLPLDRAADALFATASKSWVKFTNVPNNGYSNQLQFQPLISVGVPSESVWKADQWVALTRTHALALLALPKLFGQEVWSLFRGVSASDEMYFPTCLAVLGELGSTTQMAAVEGNTPCEGAVPNGSSMSSIMRSGGSNVPPSSNTTHQKQQSRSSSSGSSSSRCSNVINRRLTYCCWGDSPKSPETYQGLPAAVLEKGVKEGCLFIRKFKAGSVSLEEWMRHMQAQAQGVGGWNHRDEDCDGGAGAKEEEGQSKRERSVVEEGGEGTAARQKRPKNEEECPREKQ